jgi:hypothetical protein
VETEATRCVSDELRAAVKKFAEVDQWEMEFEDVSSESEMSDSGGDDNGEDDGDDRVVSFSLLTPLVRGRRAGKSKPKPLANTRNPKQKKIKEKKTKDNSSK